ncbi:regulator of G-protein signaling loco-like isoform X2 [Limulus polyphemus]|uniref:Regulator of G-protein signaling loco-like isoform X2 n=1 Tax=Limulus polyphemus TaxID=6850 RepID=A0ABM1S6P8_LIMPO|nr:regulator of G-protein signaling loco-like isoform X2 [Limulus polyphemus]
MLRCDKIFDFDCSPGKGVLVEESEDCAQRWDLAAMERYMRDHADESLALGLLSRDQVRTMRRKPEPLPPECRDDSIIECEESAECESSPSWTSDSMGNTPSYNSSGLAFEFKQKCLMSAEGSQINVENTGGHLLAGRKLRISGSLSTDQLSSYSGRDSSMDFHSDWSSKIRDKSHKLGYGNNKPLEGATGSIPSSKSTGGKISRLLRRTHSAGCSKETLAHALFPREKMPVTKTKSMESTAYDVDEKQKKERKTLAQDMKMRLSFLRRRQVEASFQQPVRPPREVVQKWAESFQELMSSKYGQALFRAFLSREFSEENIEFWLACEDFKKSRINKLLSKARKIYNDYIAVQAPREVNLDSTTRNTIFNNLSNPDHHLFDQAQKRIQGLMERDTYLRFLQSELYLELL